MLAGVREDRAERRDLDPPEQQLPDIRAEHPRPLPLCHRLGFPRVKIHLFSKIGNSSTVASLYFSVSEHTKRGLNTTGTNTFCFLLSLLYSVRKFV